jgi:PAS domain S-box-containing protein
MHRLLERQVRKCVGTLEAASPEWSALIAAVDEAYRQSDEDRLLLERSMELSSRELFERNTALAAAEANYRAIFENSTEGLFQTSPEGRLLSANPALAEIFGCSSAEELIAAAPDLAERIDVDEGRRQEILRQVAETDRAHRFEARVIRKDGTPTWVSASLRAVRAGNGKLERYEGTAHDISRRKRAEAERQELHEKLVQLSRQSGMTEVATNVLHNVGNVLNSVNISLSVASKRVRELKLQGLMKAAELLADRSDDGQAQADKVQRLPAYLQSLGEHLAAEQKKIVAEMDSLAENLEHIKQIVGAQQSYAKVTGVLEEVDLPAIVEDVIRLSRRGLNLRDQDVLCELQALPPVTADKHQVMQILVNLLKNGAQAIEESGRAGRIVVRVGESKRRPGFFFVSVEDTGVGIPRENLQRIFNHGFTTKVGGHGFGLHASANAANAMGGSLFADSAGSGAGATFTLELPIEPGARALARSV